MSSAVLGVGSPLLDVLAQVGDDFLKHHVSGAKGGMEMISPAERQSLMQHLGDQVQWVPGGSAGNTIFALAVLGAETAMFGKTGSDREGEYYRSKLLASGGSDREFVITQDAPTGICISLITPDAERTMRSDLGAAQLLTPEDVKNVDFSRYEIVLIEGYMLFSPAFDAIVEGAVNAGCRIAFDLASFEVVRIFRDRIESLLDRVDILFANADEAAELLGGIPAEEQLQRLGERCRIVALKQGKAGAFVKCQDEVVRVPAELVENPVDTTAAGDLWAAGFLYGLVKKVSLFDCAKFGAILSGEVVKVVGSQLSEEVWTGVKAKFNKITG